MKRDTVTADQHQQSVLFGRTEISYRVHGCDRKTLAIHVYPDGQVVVDAPMDACHEAIAEKVKKRASWIVNQPRQFAAYPPALPPRQYISGEMHRYLGRQYRLQVIQCAENKVKLAQGRLVVEVADPESTEIVKKSLQGWYRARAKAIFAERYTYCIGLVAKLNINHQHGFQLRFMPNRWGSCTRQGHIILNPELIAAPKDCIDYVVTHELCHLKERNHSQSFYRLLASVMKDWELRRKRLNEMVEVRFL